MESDKMIRTDMTKKGKQNDLDAQIDEVADLLEPKKAKTELKVYKRRTSTVWRDFEMLPTKGKEQPSCKCKQCGKKFIAAGAYVQYNLKRHSELCRKKFEVPLSILVSTDPVQPQLEEVSEDKKKHGDQ
uniref:BED-type domain-containing protein n=1 Tax=Quercus lobata TaxID=97700 RepID=A0A7N2MTH2_QUELO